MSAAPGRVVITGGRGMIGAALAARLRSEGRDVLVLTRAAPRDPHERTWDSLAPDPRLFEGTDAVVHLTGVRLDARWTAARRRAIRASRVDVTRALAASLARAAPPPRVLIAASAVGYYGNRGDEQLDERSALGRGFLADLAREWEAAAAAAEASGVRVARLRFGLVLDPGGGALARLLPVFRLGLGGPVGNGRQWWSWIALGDLIELIRAALANAEFSGALNAVAPEPVTAREFAITLGRVLRRPAWFPVPAVALRLAFGAMAEETLLASQRAVPARLAALGWRFRHASLESALRAVLARADAHA